MVTKRKLVFTISNSEKDVILFLFDGRSIDEITYLSRKEKNLIFDALKYKKIIQRNQNNDFVLTVFGQTMARYLREKENGK
ncbi:hypothetical protein CSB11_00020 [Candidatus Campbellbacteria bacterium]|nr:MAG: hypothetical protein CSB11_00020 [Candidatus Campbellbacteria bacterium]